MPALVVDLALDDALVVVVVVVDRVAVAVVVVVVGVGARRLALPVVTPVALVGDLARAVLARRADAVRELD